MAFGSPLNCAPANSKGTEDRSVGVDIEISVFVENIFGWHSHVNFGVLAWVPPIIALSANCSKGFV